MTTPDDHQQEVIANLAAEAIQTVEGVADAAQLLASLSGLLRVPLTPT